MQLTDRDKICIPVPLYHCFGMVLGNLTIVNRGAAMIFPNEGFDAKKTMEAVNKYKCTALYGVPTMFIEYLKEKDKNPGKYDLSNLRTGIMAGALCPKYLMERVVNELNLKDITICYGMTETSPVSF
jgi:fatty-acyl-CoA synthase